MLHIWGKRIQKRLETGLLRNHEIWTIVFRPKKERENNWKSISLLQTKEEINDFFFRLWTMKQLNFGLLVNLSKLFLLLLAIPSFMAIIVTEHAEGSNEPSSSSLCSLATKKKLKNTFLYQNSSAAAQTRSLCCMLFRSFIFICVCLKKRS